MVNVRSMDPAIARTPLHTAVELPDATRMAAMYSTLINCRGGPEHLVTARGGVNPECFEVDLALRIKD